MRGVSFIAGITVIIAGLVLLIATPVGVIFIGLGLIAIFIGIRDPLHSDNSDLIKESDGESGEVTVNKVSTPYGVRDYVVFNFETTGKDVRKCEIIEIGAYKVKRGVINETFNTFVRPSGPIPEEIVKVTGINDEMVKDAPSVEHVMSRFAEFIKGFPLMGYEITRFDIPILKRYLTGEESLNIIDLETLATTLSIPAKSKKLTDVAKFFSIKVDNPHRSLGVCFMTYHLYNALIKWVSSKSYRSKDIVEEITLENATCVLSGDFASVSREEIERAIRSSGGVIKDSVSSKTDYLIVGSIGNVRHAALPGAKVDKALELQENGSKIKIVNEDNFVELIQSVLEPEPEPETEAATETAAATEEAWAPIPGTENRPAEAAAETAKPDKGSAKKKAKAEKESAKKKSKPEKESKKESSKPKLRSKSKEPESAPVPAPIPVPVIQAVPAAEIYRMFELDPDKPLTLEDKSKMLRTIQKKLADGEMTKEEFESTKRGFLFL